MVTVDRYPKNTTVRIKTLPGFTDAAGAPVDPAAVTLTIHKPDNTVLTYTYPTGSLLLTKDAGVGLYHADVLGDVSGRWYCEWLGVTGGQETAFEWSFTIDQSEF